MSEKVRKALICLGILRGEDQQPSWYVLGFCVVAVALVALLLR